MDIQIQIPQGVDLEAELNQALSVAREQQSVSLDLSASREFKPLDHLEEFAARFPQVFRLFESLGIHPEKPTAMFDPYAKQPVKESFANIGEHCISVGFLSSRICGALVSAGLIQASDADSIVERALIHDITKPYEILRRNAVKSGLIEDAYTPAAYEALRPLLIENGLSSELADYLVNAGKETGHNSLKDFIVAGPNGLQGIVKDRIAEKIVHLADDMTFTSNPQPGEPAVTYFLTPQERMDASNFRSRYGFMWSEGLALGSDGKIVALRDLSAAGKEHQVLGNYADLQIKVATAIAREFQLYLDPASTEPAELFIKKLAHS